jgi:flagellar biosynthesis protein FlhF
MKIKRFEAKNMTSALRMIKDELGPDAVILSARSLRKGKGFFGSMKYAGVEVSAAIDNQRPVIKGTDSPAGIDIISDPARARYARSYPVQKTDRILPPVYSAHSQTYRQRHSYRKPSSSNHDSKAYSSLYQKLLDQNVDRSIASELIEEIKRAPVSPDLPGNEDLRFHLISLLKEMGLVVDETAFDGGKPKVAAFIGTTGVGKTTSIAKLAALQTIRHGKRVGLITIDNYDICANEQLKAYAQIIGIPLESAFNVTDLKQALKKLKDKELILIDTPGINPRNHNEIQDIKTYMDNVADPQIHLVLSAATKSKDLIATTEAFKEIGVSRLMFTKVDESSVFGDVVNVLIRTNIQLSLLSCGRKVPEDIETGSIKKVVDLLFQFESAGRRQPAVSSNPDASRRSSNDYQTVNGPHFVANKNSDVYHSPDCKWSKKIKPDNLIKFAGVQEAEAQNFLPCRSCNPDLFQGSARIDLKADKRKISSYR